MSVLQVYLHWANTLLGEGGRQIPAIAAFQTGRPLCRVIDTLCPDAGLCHKVQSSSQGKDLHYVQAALDHMRRNGIKFTFTPQDVLEGDIKAMLDLLWTVILNYNIHNIERSAYKRSVGTGKKLLSEWCQRQLPGELDARSTLSYNLCKNDNFVKILEQHVEVNVDNSDKLTRLSSLLQVAQEKFGILKEIVKPAEVLDKSIDEHTMLIYIALLKRKVSDGSEDTISSLSRTSSTSLLEMEDVGKDSGSGSGISRESKASSKDRVGETTLSPATNVGTSPTREGNATTIQTAPALPVTIITPPSDTQKSESKVGIKDIPSSNYSKGSLLSRLWAGDRSTKLEAKLAGKQTEQKDQTEVFVEQKSKESVLVHDTSSLSPKADAEGVHNAARDGAKGYQEHRTMFLGRPLHMSVDGSDITDDTSDWMSSSTGSIVSMSNEKQMKDDGDPSTQHDTESQLMDVISQRIMQHIPDMNESEDESTDKDTVITQTNSEHSYLSGELMKGANLKELQEDIEEEAQDFNDEIPGPEERRIPDVDMQTKDELTRHGSNNSSNGFHGENTGNGQNSSGGVNPNMQSMNPGFPMFFTPGQGPDMMKFMEVYKRMQEEELERQTLEKMKNHHADGMIQNGGLSNGVNIEDYNHRSKFQTTETNTTQNRQLVNGEVEHRILPSALPNKNSESSHEVYPQHTSIPSSRESQDYGQFRKDDNGASNWDDKNTVEVQIQRPSENHFARSQSPNSSSEEGRIPRPTMKENDLSVQFEMISENKRQGRSKDRLTESVGKSSRHTMVDDNNHDYASHNGRVTSPHRFSQDGSSNVGRPTSHLRKDIDSRYITNSEPKSEMIRYGSRFTKDKQAPKNQVRRSPVRTGNERKSRLDNFREFAQRQQEKLLPKEDRKALRERSAEKSKNISKQLDELDRELQEKLTKRLAEERLSYPHPLIDRDIDDSDKGMHGMDREKSSEEKKMVKLLSEEIDNLKSKVIDLERSQNELNLVSSQRDLQNASFDHSSSWSPSRTYPLTSKTLDIENKTRDRSLGDPSMIDMDRNLSVDDLSLTRNDISLDETSPKHQFLSSPSPSQRRAISLQDLSGQDEIRGVSPRKKVSSMRKLLDFGYSSPVRSVSQEIWGKDMSSIQDLDPERQERWKALSASSYGINEEEILQLKQCLSSATMENEIVQAKLNNFTKETSDKMKKTHEILDDSRKLLAKSQGENAELRSKLSREKIRSEALEEQMKDIRTELFRSKTEQFEMEAEMQASMDMMRDVVPPNLPGIHVLQHEKEELQDRVEGLQTEKLRLNQELDACRHQRDRAQNTVADLKNCLEDARNERKLLMEELSGVHSKRKTDLVSDNIFRSKNHSQQAEDELNNSIRSASGRLEKADLEDLFEEIQAKRSRPRSQHQRSSTWKDDDQVIFTKNSSKDPLQLGDLELQHIDSRKTIYPHRKNNSYLQSRFGKGFDGRSSPVNIMRNSDIRRNNFNDDDLSDESVQRTSGNSDIENGYHSISQYSCPCNMDHAEFDHSSFDRRETYHDSPEERSRSPNRLMRDSSPLRRSESPSRFLQSSSPLGTTGGTNRAIRDGSPLGRSCSPNRFLQNTTPTRKSVVDRSVSPNRAKRDASPISRSGSPNRFLQNSIPMDRCSSPNRFLQNNIQSGRSTTPSRSGLKLDRSPSPRSESPNRFLQSASPSARSESPNRFLQSASPSPRPGSPNRFLQSSSSDTRSRSPNGKISSSSPAYRSSSPNRLTQNGISVRKSKMPNRVIQNTRSWSPNRSLPIDLNRNQSDIGYLNDFAGPLRELNDEDDDDDEDILDSIIESPINILPSVRRSRSEENLLDMDDEFDDLPLRRTAIDDKPLKSYGSALDVRLWDDEIDDCSDLLGDRWKPEKLSLFNKGNVHLSPNHLSPKARGILHGKNGFKKFNLNRSLSPQRPNTSVKYPSHSPQTKRSPSPKRSPYLNKLPLSRGRITTGSKSSSTGVVRNLGHDFEDDDVLRDDIIKPPPTNRPKSWAEFKASLRK